MKKLQKSLKNHKYICFLDFEGTQFSHEMIAFGALFVTIDKNGNIKRKKPSIKYYVKAKNKIGKFVEGLTGIHEDTLTRVGIPFSRALREIKRYCGLNFKRTTFMTFGNHDLKILNQSVAYNLDSPKELAGVIQKNYLDFQALISEFVKDDNSNAYSLENYLKVFNLEFDGTAHDPEYDAINLGRLYQAFISNKGKLLEEYLKVLSKLRHIPSPLSKAAQKLASGQDVSGEEFKNWAEEDLL